jgi:hypothetical protein
MMAYLYGGIGAIILALCGLLWFKGLENQRLALANTGLRAQLVSVALDNATQKQAIAELTAANAEWASKAVLQAKEYKAILLDLSTANVVRNALQKALMAKESTDRQSLACQQLLGLSIAKSCPQISADMVERAK